MHCLFSCSSNFQIKWIMKHYLFCVQKTHANTSFLQVQNQTSSQISTCPSIKQTCIRIEKSTNAKKIWHNLRRRTHPFNWMLRYKAKNFRDMSYIIFILWVDADSLDIYGAYFILDWQIMHITKNQIQYHRIVPNR